MLEGQGDGVLFVLEDGVEDFLGWGRWVGRDGALEGESERGIGSVCVGLEVRQWIMREGRGCRVRVKSYACV